LQRKKSLVSYKKDLDCYGWRNYGDSEGGSKDMIAQRAQMMIGEDPFRIEYIWQNIYRGMFYRPCREKLHALGPLKMSLWDIKGKVLNAPTCFSLLSKY
jgi:L-alanine-DL-glutamate epimerase-like enolase superfamily enzyme